MILRTFNEKELLNNIRSVVNETDLKVLGLHTKYEKQVNNRKVADGTVLGVHKYTVQNNTVYAVATKQLYGKSGRKGGELVFTFYISVLNPDTGKNAYVKAGFDAYGYNIVTYSIYTEHFIERLKERNGMEFTDFIRLVGGTPMCFVETDGQFEAHIGNIRMFVQPMGIGWVVITMVTNDMLKGNQGETTKEIMDFQAEYIEYKNNLIKGAA